jgi:signal transduction histidine kinase
LSVDQVDDLSADQRDEHAVLRDEVARRRDEVARLRDHGAELRDLAAVGGGDAVDHTDASDSDHAAAVGDGAGSQRDLAADMRDRAADRRDRVAEASEAASAPGAASTTAPVKRAGLDRQAAASDRRQSGEDRTAAADERMLADADRGRSAANRAASATERADASGDRDLSAADRKVSAGDRSSVSFDIATADRLAHQARRDVVNQLERIKSDLVSRVGHEFRTPLTIILGYAKLLARGGMSPDESCRAAQAIIESGERLERIVKLMEFSASADVGHLADESSTVELGTLVEDVVDSWASILDESHVIVVETDEGSVEVMADREWLTIAVNELIDNAVKFSPEGGTVRIATRRCELAGTPAAEIALIDQGVGMSVGAHAAAFDEFTQVDASDTRRFGGLGLGLALVRGFALAHGGAVSCEAAAGGGTRVSIVIPTLPV